MTVTTTGPFLLLSKQNSARALLSLSAAEDGSAPKL
jgi:hypothetical protein